MFKLNIAEKVYNPVEEAYKLLTKVFLSPDPSYGDLLIVVEEAIGYLGEALG